MNKYIKDNFNKYIKFMNKCLLAKETSPYYNHLNGLLKLLEVYNIEIMKLNSRKDVFQTNKKRLVFNILFSTSRLYFNELKNSIIVSNHISAYCILRIIVENYIVMSFLSQKSDSFSKKYYNFSSIVLYNRIQDKDIDTSYISEEDERKIKKAYNEVKIYVENNIKNNKEILTDEWLEKNHYGWASECFPKKPTLKMISNACSKDDEIRLWYKLSSFVHNNEIIIKLEQFKKNMGDEFWIINECFEYIIKYINLYFELYKVEKQIQIEMQKLINEVAE